MDLALNNLQRLICHKTQTILHTMNFKVVISLLFANSKIWYFLLEIWVPASLLSSPRLFPELLPCSTVLWSEQFHFFGSIVPLLFSFLDVWRLCSEYSDYYLYHCHIWNMKIPKLSQLSFYIQILINFFFFLFFFFAFLYSHCDLRKQRSLVADML